MSTTARQGETILAFALACAVFLPFIRYGLNLEDEGALLAEFYRVYAGDVPVRDLHMGYTPGAYYFHAALFSVFGASTTVVRLALVVCHGLLAALLFALARRFVGVALAALPPLLYWAMMPFFPGRFASFNIPYPAWYTALFAVFGCYALVRFVEAGRAAWLFWAGLAAGLAFSFKPNVGLFMLASGAIVLLLVLEPPRHAAAHRDVALWWTTALALLPAIILVFGAQADRRDFAIFVLPVAVVFAALVVRRVADIGTVPRRDARLASASLTYAAGVVVPVLPWAIALLVILGPELFARRVLFIGTGFERSYYAPFHEAGAPDAVVVAAVVGLAVAGLLVRARRLAPAIVAVTAAIGVSAALVSLLRAEMPQGFRAAVHMRAEDLSYTTTLVVLWAGLLAVGRPLTRRARIDAVALFVIATSAACSLMVVYPRSDFMHLVTALPLVLLLAVVLADRVVRWFATSAALAAMVRAGLVGGAVGLAAVFAAPRVQSALEWDGGPSRRPRVWLDLPRAPIGLERGRAARVGALRATVEYVRTNTAPGEAIFPFPAVELVCFLADRPNATRFGYFFPGWPGHDVEAEVIATLRASPPRVIVTMHEQQWYFRGAASYYYALRAFIEAEYRLVARFGPYVVLARRDVPLAALTSVRSPSEVSDVIATLEERYNRALPGPRAARLGALHALAAERLDFPWDPVLAALDDPDVSVRRAAFDDLVDASDADVALAVARALAAGKIPPERRGAALRVLQSSADERAIEALVAIQGDTTDSQHAFVDAILAIIADKVIAREYWLGSVRDRRHAPIAGVEPSAATVMLPDRDANAEGRRYLAWLAPIGRPVDGELRWALEEALWDRDQPELVAAAATGLLQGAADVDVERLLDALLPLVGRELLFVPRLIVQLHERAPSTVVRAVIAAAEGAAPSARRELAWIAAACADRRFRETLEAWQGAEDRDLRMAAVFGLARLDAASPSTQLADRDVEVRLLAGRLANGRASDGASVFTDH